MKNLLDVQEEVVRWTELNYDVRSGTRTMHFEGSDTLIVDATTELFAGRMRVEAHLDELSKLQVCERLDLPNRYLWDDKYFDPDLRKTVLEHKFHEDPHTIDELFVRCRRGYAAGDQVRGVLSKHYRPYDNVEFIEAIVEAIRTKTTDPQQVLVSKCFVGSDLYGQAILPAVQFDQWRNGGPSMGDGGGSGGLHPGFYFRNSEVGRSKVRIHGALFRSFCSNGQIIGWQANGADFAFVHRGQKHLALMVNEAIADAFLMSEKAAEMFIEKMDAKVERTDVGKIVSEWATKYGFSVKSTEAWSAMVTSQATVRDVTEADVINDLTYIARDLQDPDEVELLQRAAGDMTIAEGRLR